MVAADETDPAASTAQEREYAVGEQFKASTRRLDVDGSTESPVTGKTGPLRLPAGQDADESSAR